MGYFIAFAAGVAVGLAVKYWWPIFMKVYNAHLDAVIEKKLKNRGKQAEEDGEDA